MTKLGPHNRLIVREADSALKPLGLQQKGRSRSWIDDHGFWIIIVEFQSHKWDPGTFLNVGVCWLWSPKEYYTFDFEHRIGSFAPNVTEAAFMTPLSEKVSEAVEAVRRYREIFQQPAATADALSTMPLLERSEHKLYNAAVASAVVGRWEIARTLAAKIQEHAVGPPKFREPVLALYELGGSLLQDPDRLSAALGAVIEQSRVCLKLPPWSGRVPTTP
jgi:hypothetical protein